MDSDEKLQSKKIGRLRPRAMKKIRDRRGAFLLPSLLTTGNMFCGFVAIMCIINSFAIPDAKAMYVELAAILILISILLDALDGRVARMTNTSSTFGLEYDSLADLVSFGLAPGLLAYSYALTPFGRFGWFASFLYLICGAMRLARFNTTTTTIDKKYSMGLPIPIASGMIASLVLLDPIPTERSSIFSFSVIGFVYLLSYLMVSKIRYRTFKEIDFRERKPTRVVVIMAILFLIFAIHQSSIFIMILIYILSGPFTRIVHKLKNVSTDIPPPKESGQEKTG